MIGSLRGTLIDRATRGEIVVEVAGVGYRVQAGPVTAAQLGDLHSEVLVWVHHHIREDTQSLYGFASRADRDAFEALLGAHGVGPALALAILSVHGPDALRRVLVDDDVAALCLVPGVGKKTAARLLIELKSRLDVELGDGVTAVVGSGGPTASRRDVREALAALGYGPEEITEALRSLPPVATTEGPEGLAGCGGAGGDVGELVKLALRALGSRR